VATIDERVKESLMIYDAFREKYPDYKKWICGHSL
jgi:putative lipase involved disintegration of autophagic bodies